MDRVTGGRFFLNEDQSGTQPRWYVTEDFDVLGVVYAPTKSEARALVKKHLGLPRVPVGVVVSRAER